MNKRSIGNITEARASEYLEAQGCTILERNYRCKLGELDIVAKDGDELVFVEVKYRRSERYGLPEQAVNRTKQANMRRVASWYLAEHRLSEDMPMRFDVIAIDSEELRWYRNAF